MAADGMMRASDADRDAAVAALGDAYSAGRLTIEEFHERTSAAYAGRTWDDLRELFTDLPERPALGADLPAAPEPDRPPEPAGPPSPPRRPRPAGSVMPFVMIWFLVMIAARGSALVVAPVVILTVLLIVTAISRRK